MKNHRISTFGYGIIGGRYILPGLPPPPPPPYKYYQQHSRGAMPQVLGSPVGKSRRRIARHWMGLSEAGGQ